MKTLRVRKADEAQIRECVLDDMEYGAIRHEVGLNSINWLAESSRSKLVEQKDTKTIELVAVRNSPEATRNREALYRTPYWAQYPILTGWLQRFARDKHSRICRAMLVMLNPGGHVISHYDVGEYYHDKERYHLVIESDGSRLRSGSDTRIWKPAEVWWFDNKLDHEAWNDGVTPRVHFIFDLQPIDPGQVRYTTPDIMVRRGFERMVSILELDDVLSADILGRLTAYMMDQNAPKARASVGVGTDNYIAGDIRKVNVVLTEDRSLLSDAMHELLVKWIEPYYGVKTAAYTVPQPLSYEKGHKYDPHVDGHAIVNGKPVKYHDRDLTAILYLTGEEIQGGELWFPNHQRGVAPRRGRLVVFPSSEDFLHAAVPVREGLRLAMVSWITVVGSTREYPLSSDAVRLVQDDFVVRVESSDAR